MSLLFVVLTPGELVGTVVGGGNPPEAVFVGFIHLLMPLGVSDHLLLLGKHLRLTHGHSAVKMFAVVHVFAVIRAAFQTRAESTKVSSVVSRGLGATRQHSGTLSSQDMWRYLRVQTSAWGIGRAATRGPTCRSWQRPRWTSRQTRYHHRFTELSG